MCVTRVVPPSSFLACVQVLQHVDAGIAKAQASEVTAGRDGGLATFGALGGEDAASVSSAQALQRVEDAWAGYAASSGASVSGSAGWGPGPREGEGACGVKRSVSGVCCAVRAL